MLDLKITDYLKQPELLAMLAEECSELAQAALKLRRVIDGSNPTPKGYRQALCELTEEMADVELCMEQIVLTNDDDVVRIKRQKQARWLARLMEQRRNENGFCHQVGEDEIDAWRL